MARDTYQPFSECDAQEKRRFKPLNAGFTLVNPIRKALILVALMLLSPWAAADVSTWQGPISAPDDAGIDPSNSTYDGFVIPTNSTITGAEYTVQPKWIDAEDNGTFWSSDSMNGFSKGQVNGTSFLTSNGDLTLATNSTYGKMTDFESILPQFAYWSTQGDEFWRPVNLSRVTYGPQNTTDGNYVAGTNGTLLPGSEGYLRSEFWPVPEVVRYFNLSFDRWNSFDVGDLAELHYSIDNGNQWQLLDNWSGNTSDWISENYSLDSLIQGSSTIGFRFYVKKLNQSISTEGLFIDSFNLSNQGDPLAAWFHGNASGEYSPYADGTLIVPVNLSGLTAPLELTYRANWDIQGGNFDNLVVMISETNGSTWTIMSPLPGVPAHGIPVGGTTYNQQSYGWREIQHPFPHWAAGNQNASNMLLKFRIQTDGTVNHGGGAIDGWEGIMIDDLRVLSAVGTSNMQTRLLANFTDNSTQYLETSTGYPNEWQHVNWEGYNGPWSSFDSFEEVQGLPSGWRVDHVRGSTPWERGAIDNSNGYGPNHTSWPSGTNGMGINLDGIYSNHVYTHLVSPTYSIPENATARLTFNHWICTEADWDGGSIFTSIDDGLTWQHFGHNISGFYERTSTVNPNSPFYGLGIFDGSTVVGGCGNSNSNHTFSRISGDVSHLAGNDVRMRFSFFTDTYIETDGWYIDDAGIVIDRFLPSGVWTSPVIEADEFGWARLTSLYEMPDETNVLVDVLDINDAIIEGHENLTLPFDLHIGTWEHDKIKFRVKLFSENETITPRIQILHHGFTEYLNLEMLAEMDPNLPQWVLEPEIANPNLEYTIQIEPPAWRPYSDIEIECEGNISARLYSITNRIPVLSNGPLHPSAYNQGVEIDEAECSEVLTNGFGPAQATTIELRIQGGESFEWVKIEPKSLLAPKSPAIDLGADGIIDWMWNGTFHHTTTLHSLEIDGTDIQINEPINGFEANFSENLNFSILLPARNITSQTWDCGIINQSKKCYNGGFNFITNGSRDYSATEDYIWVDNSGFLHYMTEYQFEFVASNPQTSFKLLSLNYYSGFNHSISINSSLDGLLVENLDSTSNLPVKISTNRGGIIFDGDIFHEKSIIDSWISLPQMTFRPGLIQTAISKHEILDGTPELDSISLSVSTSSNIADSIVTLTVDNLDSGGRFIQNSGAGILELDSSNCSWDGINATWSLKAKWMLDDYSRLYWFASGTNADEITLGPAMGVSGTAQYAASTNDLEIIDLKAWADGRALHDFSSPTWPLNVMGDEQIVVSGKVRYSGLNGINPLPNEAKVSVQLLNDEAVIANVSTNYGLDGKFNATISTPNDSMLSGSQLKLVPIITEIGNVESNTAYDATSPSQEIRLILDVNNSEVISLEIDSPGENQPADGHVWHPGQDIPLILHIEDDNGLPEKMTLFYNRSGRAWESIEFLTPVGSTSAIIDLPLIDESGIALPDQESGWLDVFIHGTDLAGNPLIGGGSYDEPYARIHVQPRYDTWISGESLGLDRVDGYLFPGNTHKFNFTVSDENGIDSIDSMRLELSKDSGMCYIEWIPWSGEIIHDVGCFIKPPSVEANQRWQANTWDVYFNFELRWDIEDDLGEESNIPALSLWDENAPLDAVFTSISIFNWSIHSGIDLKIQDVNDKIAPIGEFIDGVSYIHAQDIVDVSVIAYHHGYDVPAQNLPFTAFYQVDLIGDKNSSSTTNTINSDGTSKVRIVIDSAFYGTQIKMLVELSNVYDHQTESDDVDFVIDESSPTISVTGGQLAIIDSDKLDQVPIQVMVADDNGLSNQPVTVFWNYVRQGRIVENSEGTAFIPVEFQSFNSNLYSAVIDLNTSSDLQKGDSIMIWFEGKDASGRPIIGNGTSEVEPIDMVIRWIAYEPELIEIITTPYRPELGDIILVECTVQNIGLISGNSTLLLIDGENKVLEEINFTLLATGQYRYTFEVEAWQEGDLGLKLQLDGQEITPVPISSVGERVSESSSAQTTLLGVSVLSVFIAGILLFIANNRRNNQYSFDEEE